MNRENTSPKTEHRASEVSALINEKDRIDYIKFTHNYICYLNQLYDNRATSLIIAVSVVEAIALGIVNFLSTSNKLCSIGYFLIVISIIILFISLLSLIICITPRSPDPQSPMYSASIMQKSKLDFINEMKMINYNAIINNICRETSIVSYVVERKDKWIKRSLVCLIIGIISLSVSIIISI